MERQDQSALGQQVHDKHQHGDELLARGGDESYRNASTLVFDDKGLVRNRQRKCR